MTQERFIFEPKQPFDLQVAESAFDKVQTNFRAGINHREVFDALYTLDRMDRAAAQAPRLFRPFLEVLGKRVEKPDSFISQIGQDPKMRTEFRAALDESVQTSDHYSILKLLRLGYLFGYTEVSYLPFSPKLREQVEWFQELYEDHKTSWDKQVAATMTPPAAAPTPPPPPPIVPPQPTVAPSNPNVGPARAPLTDWSSISSPYWVFSEWQKTNKGQEWIDWAAAQIEAETAWKVIASQKPDTNKFQTEEGDTATAERYKAMIRFIQEAALDRNIKLSSSRAYLEQLIPKVFLSPQDVEDYLAFEERESDDHYSYVLKKEPGNVDELSPLTKLLFIPEEFWNEKGELPQADKDKIKRQVRTLHRIFHPDMANQNPQSNPNLTPLIDRIYLSMTRTGDQQSSSELDRVNKLLR